MKRYSTDCTDIDNLNETFVALIMEVFNYIANNNIDVRSDILPFLINPPLSFKKTWKFKSLLKKRRQLLRSLNNGEGLMLFLSTYWDELHPNILFHLINGLNSKTLTEMGLRYQEELIHFCKVAAPTNKCLYHPEIGSRFCCEKEFLVIGSDGDIKPPGVTVARRRESNADLKNNYKHHLGAAPEGFSQSIALEICIIRYKLSCSQFIKSTSEKFDKKGEQKPKKYYLDEIEKFIGGCNRNHRGGKYTLVCVPFINPDCSHDIFSFLAYIWYFGHSEKDTGNWCFKDGTISFDEILDIYRRQQRETLLTIISDCSFSGNFVRRYAEILDNENIPPCGHKTNDTVRIYSSTRPLQEAQELCYSDRGVEVRRDGDFLFLDTPLTSQQSTYHGDFTKLVCCGGPMDSCRMDEDMKGWTWTEVVEGKFRHYIYIIKGYQRGRECWYMILLSRDGEYTKYEAEITKGKIDAHEWGCILYSAIDEQLPRKLIYKVTQRTFI